MSKGLEIRVPDIGDFDEVEVVEILVAKGDVVAIDDGLVSIESDKATMEIPTEAAGVVTEVAVSEGDKVSEGSLLVVLEAQGSADASAEEEAEADAGADDAGAVESEAAPAETVSAEPVVVPEPTVADATAGSEGVSADQAGAVNPLQPLPEKSRAAAHPVPDRSGLPHASPLVRRYARELGVPVAQAEGSGPQGRVLVEDLKRHVRSRFAEDAAGGAGAAGGSAGIPAIPFVDPAQFGPIEEQKLTRIQKVSGPGLQRSWLNVPHVTQHDEADVTELERFRRDRKELAAERGVKLSPLLFVMKGVAVALREFPTFRSMLAPEGDRLLVKEYCHLGIAVDTDQGLVVPVIRDVDRKGVFELAEEVSATAGRARDRKLGPDDLRGACFTISSLGGIGGSAFTPIVNAPEVAILGLSKTRTQPVWNGPSPLDLPLDRPAAVAADSVQNAGARAGEGAAPASQEGFFEPRLVMPLSLSYDHRVIDGAEAVRFTSRLSRILSDPMQLLL
ncbi:MAG: 2-oxo acid dehydrogenase subunit E2 [Myxococcota bacterium]